MNRKLFKGALAPTLVMLMMLPLTSLAQLNRGTLTGTVTDASGGAVPGVRVNVRNTATNAAYQTTTSESGQYTVANLPPGPYEINFEAAGFKRLTRAGVQLGATEVLRVDLQLEVGQVSETVNISGDVPRLQTDSPEVGVSLSNKSLVDLPLSFGSGRLAEDFAFKIAPGVVGDPFRTRVNGGTEMSKEVLLDGESVSTLRSGHFQESSVSVEALGEFKVQTSGISAEYGRTQGGVFNFVMKSGANEVHGSAFGALRNEALNANTFANNARGVGRDKDRRQDYAFSFGGPVRIPKIYNGRDKTFFYSSYERFKQRQLGFGAPSRTAPLPEFYDGDFSRLLTNVQVGTDALGRPVYRGAIYDPATFRQVADQRPGANFGRQAWVGDVFPGNKIPANRFSRVSQTLNAIMKKEYLPTVRDSSGQIPLVRNMLFPLANEPEFDQHQFSTKIDQAINVAHKLSGSISATRRPRFLTDQGGIWNINDPEGGTYSKARRQNINSWLARVSHDWTISPRIQNYFGLSFNRMTEFARTVKQDVDGPQELGIQNTPHHTGYPAANWGGGPFVTLDTGGNSQNVFNAWSSSGLRDTVSWSLGRHFVKFGVDLRRNYNNTTLDSQPAFNFNAVSTAIPNEPFAGTQIGYSFASYLLGIVHSGNNLTDRMTLGDRRYYYSGFVHDDFKVSARLTLNLGLRWEYSPPVFEAYDRFASWSPTAIDPVSKLPGAYEFAGDCATCTGRRYFGKRDFNNFGPRFGFAYRPAEKWVVRGSYGVFYEADLPGGGWFPASVVFPWVNTYTLNAASVDAWRGIFNWDAGFPTNALSPGQRDASFGNRTRPLMVDPEYGLAPYTQQWSLNIQRELPLGLVLDVGYIGNKGTKLRNGEQGRINQLPPSALAAYGARLSNPVRNAAEAASNGVPYPYAGFSGTVASALREFPQVQGNQTVQVYGSPEGFSNYHSLQLVLNKQFSRGLNAYANYVWSKSLTNTRSSATARAGDQPSLLDQFNRGLEKSLSDADTPHVFKGYVSYELPVGKGRALLGNANRWVDLLAGGWNVSAIVNYYSGTPLRFSASSPHAQWNGGANRPNVAQGSLLNPSYKQSEFDFFNASSPANTFLDKSKFSDPGALRLGTAAAAFSEARNFPVFNEDLALQKVVRVGEKYRLQLRAEFLNAFNRYRLGGVNTNVTSPVFGQVTTVSGNRQIQIGARLDF